ncbi:hypothetical protein F-E9_254 [Faustovirus]|nr:hypothetical protein F-E9_254 [Faustovirus]
MAAKHILNKIKQDLKEPSEYVLSIVNTTNIFVCIYGDAFEIDERSLRLLELLDINDGCANLVMIENEYYKVERVPTTIKRKALNPSSGTLALTYVIKITNLTE